MKSPDSPRAMVIGGSLGGLFAATALRAIGWQVDVFERSPAAMDSRGGGIVLQADVLQHFAGHRTVMVGDGSNDAEIVREADYGIAAQLIHSAPEVLIESADCIVNGEEALCRILSRL